LSKRGKKKTALFGQSGFLFQRVLDRPRGSPWPTPRGVGSAHDHPYFVVGGAQPTPEVRNLIARGLLARRQSIVKVIFTAGFFPRAAGLLFFLCLGGELLEFLEVFLS